VQVNKIRNSKLIKISILHQTKGGRGLINEKLKDFEMDNSWLELTA